MDTYFKMCCAQEEIEHLNIEIPHVATFLWDEELYLHTCEDQVSTFDAPLALQIYICQMEHEHFTQLHNHCLTKFLKLKGFSGSILPGVAMDQEWGQVQQSQISWPLWLLKIQASCILQIQILHKWMNLTMKIMGRMSRTNRTNRMLQKQCWTSYMFLVTGYLLMDINTTEMDYFFFLLIYTIVSY